MMDLIGYVLTLVAALLPMDVVAALLGQHEVHRGVERIGRVALAIATAIPTLTQELQFWMAVAPAPTVDNPILLFQADPTTSINNVISQIIGVVKPIGVALAVLGAILWGLAKLASPIMPEWASQNQGFINKAFIGMLALGLAPTLINVIAVALNLQEFNAAPSTPSTP